MSIGLCTPLQRTKKYSLLAKRCTLLGAERRRQAAKVDAKRGGTKGREKGRE
ncbi:hypothetical protein IV77_GL001683 [Olsenella uli DSM 7084]|nr:hypothetical protein IV77_GL001683 [Olsenella uli DSM 7084]